MKIKTTGAEGKVEVIDATPLPYQTVQENFNFYAPNVAADHPLFGKTIKVKLVVKQIWFRGCDDLGNPQVNIAWDTVVAVE